VKIEIDAVPPKEHLLFLHLSDIHFREPYCLNQETDHDHPVRKALLNDIRTMSERLGPVDAVLVCGDLAFKAHPEEYKVAAEWLSDVTRVSKCKINSIYTIPGNHDINRNCAAERMVQAIRKMISVSAPGNERDKELHDTLLHEQTSQELLKPMAEYNLFAASFGCDLTPKLPFWVKELILAPGWKLKLHGLTTTLLSGPDEDSKGSSLYLGALQRAFAIDDGIVHLAMMHHPPDWLVDNDDLDDALWNSCAVHLLGHKHRQRYLAGENGVRLAGGAVNPSRTERNWEPGYNFLKLKISSENGKNFLVTECYLRNWQDNPDRFVAKMTQDDVDVFSHKVLLRQRPLPIWATRTEGGVENLANTGASKKGNKLLEVAEMPSPHRDLVFNFWKLSPSQRRKIMQGLNLLENSDDQLPETQRYRMAFERAQKNGKIEVLEEAISHMLAQ